MNSDSDLERSDTIPRDPELTRWRRASRRHQADWRTERGYPAGTQRTSEPQRKRNPAIGPTRPIGSRIDYAYAKRTGANFLTPDALSAAKHRLEKTNRQRHETLDEERLWCDLLSSMPLCFNLFGPAWAHRDLAAEFAHRWFPNLCPPDAEVEVHFEWSPGRRDPQWLGDKTAFDVALLIKTPTDRRVVGIETKYHEAPTRSSPTRLMPNRYRELSDAANLFADSTWAAKVWGTQLEQIWRDHLLAVACAQHSEGWRPAAHVFVAPQANPSWKPLADQYRSLLAEPGTSTFSYRSLDSLLDSAIDLLPHAKVFRERYLNVDMNP